MCFHRRQPRCRQLPFPQVGGTRLFALLVMAAASQELLYEPLALSKMG
jgi:hypothetical protein